MYRLFVTGVVLMWLGAMAALFARDVWPAWSAQDAPPLTRERLAQMRQPEEQYGIFGAKGQRIGTAWNDFGTRGNNMTIDGTVLLDGVAIFSAVRVETATEIGPDGGLDSFLLDIHGVPMTEIRIHGERHGIYFPCELQVGPVHRQANLDLSASRMIGESLRPFSFLPTLKVGQAWRMQLVDPIAAIMSRTTQFTAIVAQVTKKETIEHLGRPVECFVVETSPGRVKAWSDETGRVLIQQAEIPGLGRITLREEVYDGLARDQARKRIPTTPHAGW